MSVVHISLIQDKNIIVFSQHHLLQPTLEENSNVTYSCKFISFSHQCKASDSRDSYIGLDNPKSYTCGGLGVGH